MGPAIAVGVTAGVVAGTVTGILRVGEWVIQIIENVIDVVKGAMHVVMNILEGIQEFVESVAHGDVGGAFVALGKGFVNAFETAVNTIADSVTKAWGVVVMIGQDLVKLAKTYLFFIPPKWLSILISLAISVAIGVMFTPLVLGAFGIVASTWTGIILDVAIGVLIFDPIQEQTINRFVASELGLDENGNEKAPPETTVWGHQAKLDEKNQRYCFDDSGKQYCLYLSLAHVCLMKNDQVTMCNDPEKGWYIKQDGIISFYDPETNLWNPPLKKSISGSNEDTILFEGNTLTMDKELDQYCSDTEDGNYVCLDKSKKELCYTSNDSYICKGKKGYYTQFDGKTYILNGEKWVEES